jgi:membrane-associated protease RseP (regulator of RpoE activity)
MQPEQKLNGTGQNSADQSGTVICAQCGAPMPEGMRFCRSCGHRLGEGSAEYTETVRLPNATAAADGRATTQFVPGYRAPLAQQTGTSFMGRQTRRFSGMTWVFIAIAIFFGVGGLLSTVVKNARTRIPASIRGAAASDRSYFGVNNFKSANGGVSFDVVKPPGSPADIAGLVGGDIITSFDGHAAKDRNEMMDVLRQTPVGKTVEVIYLRDGETKKTQLTTISEDAFNALTSAFDDRPEGKGLFGFEESDTERVQVQGTNLYGVRLDNLSENAPADIAGVKEGDIVIEFDGVPIRTPDEFLSRVRRAIPRSTVKIVVMRDGERLEMPVKMGKA